MPRNPIPWKRNIVIEGQEVDEVAYLTAHANEYTAREWGVILGRSAEAVLRKSYRLGVRLKEDVPTITAGRPALAQAHEAAAQQQHAYQGIEPGEIVKRLRERPHAMEELSQLFDRSEQSILCAIEDMCNDGYAICRRDREVEMRHYGVAVPPPRTLADEKQTRLSLAIYSDTHNGDKTAQPTALRAFLQEARDKYGVTVAVHCGDVMAGNGVYPGQVQDLQAVSAEDQMEVAMENIPAMAGLHHYILGGNHDFSFYKQIGLDVVQLLCSKREDFTYVGSDFAQIPLTKDLDVALWHPAGGIPYALSYKGQRFLNQIAADELEKLVLGTTPSPRICLVAAGHLHQSVYFRQGHIAYFQVGCFEGRNSFFKRKGWKPAIGGYVVDLDITESCLIHVVGIHDLWYHEITDDFKSYPRYARRQNVQIKPLFWCDEKKGGEADATANPS